MRDKVGLGQEHVLGVRGRVKSTGYLEERKDRS
jgi:hypothetical protein